jgi:hypothetical protein
VRRSASKAECPTVAAKFILKHFLLRKAMRREKQTRYRTDFLT